MKTPFTQAAMTTVALVILTQVSYAVQNANIIAHWRFDEEFGTVAADSAPSDTEDNPATYDDAGTLPSWGAGFLGGGATLSGSAGSFFRTNDLTELDGATALTIAGWFRFNGTQSGYRGLAMTRQTDDNTGAPTPTFSNSWGLGRDGGGNFDIRSSSGGIDVFRNGDEVVPVGEWVHVAMTWDGAAGTGGTLGQSKAYVDGVLEGSFDSEAATMINTFGEMLLGSDDCCGQRQIDATLDDIGIWDIALTELEVAQVYNQAVDNQLDLQDVGAPILLPGDVNRDNVVSPADYEIIRTNFGQTIPGDTSARGFGDLSGDNEVGIDDYLEWRSFFTGDPDPVAAGTAVPEPSSILLAALAASFCAVRAPRKG